ncbi:Nuclease harbi1-like protein [Temnothorax longispinosus]|uniref:Nuclease harbi1-like protein n=1 Tax=Temnothorax longispinosus TaxID=300112 RepID=A0A4S2L1W1_9HYME|nr:Nuclease harbi1-like protein [Temnothorax longispinosus]
MVDIYLYRFLAHGDSVKLKAWEFRIGRSTMYKIVNEVFQAIWTVLQPFYLPEPSPELWMQFPNCVGAIDGRHMQIQTSGNSGSELFNYKKYFSLATRHISLHGDGEVWNNSALADALEHEETKLPPLKMLPGSHINSSHEAFPLKLYLMSPYPRAALQDKQRTLPCSKSYREHFRHSRISMAYSQEVHICNNPHNAQIIFQALVCLHNFVMTEKSKETPQHRTYCPSNYVDQEDEEGNTIPGTWRTKESDRLHRIGRVGANNPTRTSAQLRDTLCDYFISEAGEEVAPWQYQRAFRGAIINPPHF